MNKSLATDSRDYERRSLAESVSLIIDAVRRRGDDAVRAYALQQDGWTPDDFRLSPSLIESCMDNATARTLADIRFAQAPAKSLAAAQRAALEDLEVEVVPGLRVGHRHVPLGSVGVMNSDGQFTPLVASQVDVTMARAAGVARVVACAPPRGGLPAQLTVAALHLAGVDDIYGLGGVHALAALALGTESIPRVDVVVGAGNPAMIEAGRQLLGSGNIELAAGAAEILVIADDSADPRRVAVDLIGPEPHRADTRGVLVSTSSALAARVAVEIERIIGNLACGEPARLAWSRNGTIDVVETAHDACALVDRYAFQQVEIITEDPRWYVERLRNCRALFLGSGTSALLGGSATTGDQSSGAPRSSRGGATRWVGDFLKTVTYQECVDPLGSRLAIDDLERQWRGHRLDDQTQPREVRRTRIEQGDPVGVDVIRQAFA